MLLVCSSFPTTSLSFFFACHCRSLVRIGHQCKLRFLAVCIFFFIYRNLTSVNFLVREFHKSFIHQCKTQSDQSSELAHKNYHKQDFILLLICSVTTAELAGQSQELPDIGTHKETGSKGDSAIFSQPTHPPTIKTKQN